MDEELMQKICKKIKTRIVETEGLQDINIGKRIAYNDVLSIIAEFEKQEYVRKELVMDGIRLAYGKVSKDPFDFSEAFEELLDKIQSL